jgi:DUF4097 and DUF4098 domain-containing protein YvlB
MGALIPDREENEMKTFEMSDPIAVTLEIGMGEVGIDASDRTDGTVEVLPSDPRKKADVAAAEQTRVEFANGHLLIKSPKGGWKQWVSWSSGSVDVRIALPTGSRVRADTGAGTLRSTGRLGESRFRTGAGNIDLDDVGPLDLKTGVGDVSVDRAHGKAQLSSGSGSIRIGSIDGPLVVKNANGNTWIGEVTGEARISAANGTITVDRAREGVVAKTANGDVRLADVAHGAVVAQSAFGQVDVGVREGSAVWLDLDTKFGTVESELDASSSPGANDEVVEVHAHTSYGDISVRRAAATTNGRDGS